MSDALHTKKEIILEAAHELGIQKWSTAEIDQLRRKLIADHGEAGKSSNDYIAEVLNATGQNKTHAARIKCEREIA